MSEPRLTERAEDDLAEIWATIAAARDERTADRMHRKILEACRSHARLPESGRLRDDLAPGLRSFPVRPYVVFFRPEEETILVLRILHGRRDTERIMPRGPARGIAAAVAEAARGVSRELGARRWPAPPLG